MGVWASPEIQTELQEWMMAAPVRSRRTTTLATLPAETSTEDLIDRVGHGMVPYQIEMPICERMLKTWHKHMLSFLPSAFSCGRRSMLMSSRYGRVLIKHVDTFLEC